MDIQKKKKNWKLNNDGAAIVTSVVVIAFLAILTTIVLYSSGMNFIMKTNDVKIKKSFYVAETALEEIKAQLVEEVSYASGKAYTQTMMQYAGCDASVRAYTYKDAFFDQLKNNWDQRLQPGGGITMSYQDMMQKMVDDTYALLYPGETNLIVPKITCAGGIEVEGDHARIKNVELLYTDADGYTTEIQTDFWISVPDINWAADQYLGSYREGEDASNAERETIEMVDCVRYHNWMKK